LLTGKFCLFYKLLQDFTAVSIYRINNYMILSISWNTLEKNSVLYLHEKSQTIILLCIKNNHEKEIKGDVERLIMKHMNIQIYNNLIAIILSKFSKIKKIVYILARWSYIIAHKILKMMPKNSVERFVKHELRKLYKQKMGADKLTNMYKKMENSSQ
jgi:hypothetical protein